MVDWADKAAEETQRELDRHLLAAKLPPANTVTDCIDCENKIEPQRKESVPHAVRCGECQTCYDLDKKRGLV